jgi:RNA ligase
MFPHITHINDVMHVAKDNPFFNVVDKGDYTVINYMVQTDDTFPSLNEPGISDEEKLNRMIMREFRGIIFDTKGNIIRRPLHKFFNHGQISIEEKSYNDPHDVVIKYDGSMIVPFKLNNEFIFGTKMGYTEVAKPVMEFVKKHPKYVDFSEHLLKMGYNPIFEWCSLQQQIVIAYPDDMLVLLEIRHLNTGEYMSMEDMKTISQMYGIPSVEIYGMVHNIDSFLQHVKDLKDQEGYIIRFHNGDREKVKADEYLAKHRVVSDCNSEKQLIKLIIDDKLDDIIPTLPENIKVRVEDYYSQVSTQTINIAKTLYNDVLQMADDAETRKDFAMMVTEKDKAFQKIYFMFYNKVQNGQTDFNVFYKEYLSLIENSLNRISKIEENRHYIGGVSWKEIEI